MGWAVFRLSLFSCVVWCDLSLSVVLYGLGCVLSCAVICNVFCLVLWAVSLVVICYLVFCLVWSAVVCIVTSDMSCIVWFSTLWCILFCVTCMFCGISVFMKCTVVLFSLMWSVFLCVISCMVFCLVLCSVVLSTSDCLLSWLPSLGKTITRCFTTDFPSHCANTKWEAG